MRRIAKLLFMSALLSLSATAFAQFTPVFPSGNLDPNTYANGMVFEEFEGNWDFLPDFDQLGTPDLIGIAAEIAIEYGSRDLFARRYVGLVHVEVAGDYTFYTSSDDGSQLFLDDTMIVDNDGLHGEQERNSGLLPCSLATTASRSHFSRNLAASI